MSNKLKLCVVVCFLLSISCDDDDEPVNSHQGLSKPGFGVTDADGNFYETIVLMEGSDAQEWMASNLRTTKYANGDPIANVTDDTWQDLQTGAWCYYGNDPEMDARFGKLYNGWAAGDHRNLCPNGWRPPTYYELYLLAQYLGGDDIAGGAFKEEGTSNWVAPNADATNLSDLAFLPGGYREGYVFDYFDKAGRQGRYWGAGAPFESGHEFYELSNQDGKLAYGGMAANGLGFSCRCLREK